MKFYIIMLFLIFTSLTINAQTYFGQQNVVYDDALNTTSIFVIDLDNDNDLDIISNSSGRDEVFWLENTDGNGSFSAKKVITTDADFANNVFAADIDGDGFADVLSSSYSDNKIAWYKNNGDKTFGAQQIISTDITSAINVYAGYIDNDNFVDVIAVSYAGKISWFQNTDGNGTFGTEQEITTAVDQPNSVILADFDNDLDFDLLSGSRADNKIAWYENDGSGNFGSQQIISTSVDQTRSVFASDLNNDGYKDVISASFGDDKIAWYENNGDNTFGTQQVISSTTVGANFVYTADIDGDGDNDVLAISQTDNEIVWFENTDGNGNFALKQTITSDVDSPNSLAVGNLNSDQNIEIFSSSYNDKKIAWYENLTLEVTSQPQNQNTCPNSIVNFSIEASNVENYQWQLNSGSGFNNISDDLTYSGTTTETLTVNATESISGYVYRCQLTNPGGSSYSDNAELIVEDITNPEIPILPPLTGECSATATAPTTTDNCAGTITGTTTDPLEYTEQGTYTITWNFDDGNGNSIDVDQNVIVDDVTNPTMTCVDNQTVTANENHVYVVNGTEFDPTETSDNCSVDYFENDFNSTNTLNGEELPEGENIIEWTIYDEVGNSYSCSTTITVNAYVGIADLSVNGISLYPNPTTGIFRLANVPALGNVKITDVTGKTVQSFSNLQIDEFSNLEFDISNQPSGIYFIKIQTNEGVYTEIIIKK